MNSLKSIALNISIPFFISAVLGSMLFYEDKIPKIIFSIVPYLFYAISALILWVSWHFNRNRFIFIILPLLLIYFGFVYLGGKRATDLFLYASMLYPLHLLLFLSLKERGLFSIWGILKIAFFVVEIAVILYLVIYPNADFIALLKMKLFVISFYPLEDISIIIAILVIFIMVALVLFNRYLLYNSSFLVIAVTFYMGFYFIKTSYAKELSLLAIGVIIFILLIRESYRLAFYDELTSLPGRRALVEDMAKLGMKYSLAMIDIDHFKKFNDTYGHDTGDEVLKMVASKLAEVGGGGKAYRYGGEEFVLLFPSREVDESYKHTDILRETIAKSPFIVRNKQNSKTIYINISSGIVQKNSQDKDPFAVMKRADNALYKAKKAGRNQVVKA
ncbi:MAG: diguanylate cyclase [Sulfurimonas sp. RIFOXYD12_FULL_36_11]|uniref:GGDEF domain-containing protein n=1 Tax=unclassified Sulfurimonas TaxID=2623549 RepID=UPI0008D1DF48|nr:MULTISPECIES: GGDEF domain-containing protein [unclassified Sulfurimonas]MDD3854431.1 GGDEF domain-containing protein [Sulfurimonas sp.]OHE04685.1 MAG: diguanylate cyclase [Sulfurimonas sp. RIFOXYB12_FULL_35_9]OHE12429.1 MAG: diguanylate cyclase [Sulfurimonas sp. RIFOXYC2_FULL_36_7]OHE17817.1 MAG: diguanylate cyclase [Sulfurimonas sp. RIFOXYD12_FULL_36_11]